MTKEEIAAVLAEHKSWLEGNGGKRANMRYANMRGANMRYADMRGADMRYANMRYAKMEGANMESADMEGAKMEGANMEGANMRYANMRGANMRYANMRGADMRGADMRYANMEGANMEGADMRYANMRYAKINDKTVIGILRRATRSDGYEFFLWHCKEGYFIKAGCRFLDMEAARQHWTNTRQGTALGDESLDILDFFDAAIKRQGGAA